MNSQHIYIFIVVQIICMSLVDAKLKGRYLEHPEHYDVPILAHEGNGGEGGEIRLHTQHNARSHASHSLSFGRASHLNTRPMQEAVATKTVTNKHHRIERPPQVSNRAPSSFNKHPTPRQTKNLRQQKSSNSRRDGRRPSKRHGRRSLKRFVREIDTPNLESDSASKEKPDSHEPSSSPSSKFNIFDKSKSSDDSPEFILHNDNEATTEEVASTDAPNLEDIFQPVPGPYMRSEISKPTEAPKRKPRYGIYNNWDEYLQAQRSAYMANMDKTEIFEDTGYKPVVDPDEHFRFVDKQFKAKNDKVKAFHTLYISLKKQFKPFIVLKHPV